MVWDSELDDWLEVQEAPGEISHRFSEENEVF